MGVMSEGKSVKEIISIPFLIRKGKPTEARERVYWGFWGKWRVGGGWRLDGGPPSCGVDNEESEFLNS